jgi:hypothetical protein
MRGNSLPCGDQIGLSRPPARRGEAGRACSFVPTRQHRPSRHAPSTTVDASFTLSLFSNLLSVTFQDTERTYRELAAKLDAWPGSLPSRVRSLCRYLDAALTTHRSATWTSYCLARPASSRLLQGDAGLEREEMGSSWSSHRSSAPPAWGLYTADHPLMARPKKTEPPQCLHYHLVWLSLSA